MTKEQALKKIEYDKILDEYEDSKFFEFTVRYCGDVMTFRVYKNSGSVTMR